MLESDIRQKVVDTARQWVGLNGKDGSKRAVIDTYNRIRPLPRGYKLTMRDAWCAGTVSAVAYVTGCLDIIPPECSCHYMIHKFQQLGQWVERDSYRPRPADIIFYDWQDSGYGDCRGVADHVGIVAAVDGNRLTIVEGNKHDAVALRYINVDGWGIRGYGVPDYKGHAIDESVDKLATLYVIDSPSYWKAECRTGVKYLPDLIGKAANAIKKADPRCATASDGVKKLISARVISSPDYWLAQAAEHRNVAELIKALGGCVYS